jgi:hypothetical protein
MCLYLHLHTFGPASGGPTVILEGGAGLGSVTGRWLLSAGQTVAQEYRHDQPAPQPCV